MRYLIVLAAILSVYVDGCINTRTYRDGEFVFYKGVPYVILEYKGHGIYAIQSEDDSSIITIDEIFIYE
jgi:hypothetical protein